MKLLKPRDELASGRISRRTSDDVLEILAASDAPALSEARQETVHNHIRAYLQAKTPILVEGDPQDYRTKKAKGLLPSPRVLFVPLASYRGRGFGSLRPDNQQTQIFVTNGQDCIWGYEGHERIPVAMDYNKGRGVKRLKTQFNVNIDSNIVLFSDIAMRRVMENNGSAGGVSAQFTSNVLKGNGNLGVIFEPNLLRFGNIDREYDGFIYYCLGFHDASVEVVSIIGPRQHHIYDISSEDHRAIRDALERGQSSLLKQYTDLFLEGLDDESLDIMRTYPSARRSALWSFLTPHDQTMKVRPLVDGKEQGKPINIPILNEDAATKRRAVLQEYPILFHALPLRNDKERDKAKKAFNEGETSFEVAQILLGLTDENAPRTLEILQALDLDALDAETLAGLQDWVHYIAIVPDDKIPQTPDDWAAFRHLIEMDQKLEKAGLIHNQKLLKDLLLRPERDDEFTHTNGCFNWEAHQAVYSSQAVSQMVVAERRFGLSIIVPAVAQIRRQYERDDISDESMVLVSVTNESMHEHSADHKAKNYLKRPGAMTLTGQMLRGVSIQQRLRSANSHADYRSEWEDIRLKMAGAIAFNRNPHEFKWEALPVLPIERLRRGEFDSMKEGRLYVSPFQSPAQVLQMAQDIGQSVRVSEYLYDGIHFTGVINNENDQPQAIVVLRQNTQSSVLELELDTIYSVKGDLLLDRGHRAAKDNLLVAAIHDYISFIHEQKIDAAPYNKRRAELLEMARKQTGLEGVIGHDPLDPDQNRKVRHALSSFDMFYDYELEDRSDNDVTMLEGAVIPDRLYQAVLDVFNDIGDEEYRMNLGLRIVAGRHLA